MKFYEGPGAGRGAPYPGEAPVRDWSEQFCSDQFQPFIGVAWTSSQFELDTWWPSEESWLRGDRKVACAVSERSGTRGTGSARGANR